MINPCVGYINGCRFVFGIGDGRRWCCAVLLPFPNRLCVLLLACFSCLLKPVFDCICLFDCISVSAGVCVCSGSSSIVKL